MEPKAVSVDSFSEFISDPLSTVALYFWNPDTPDCNPMDVAFDDLAKRFTNVKFLKIHADEFPNLTEKFNVPAVPVFILLRGGFLFDRVNGANSEELERKVAVVSNLAAMAEANRLAANNEDKAQESAPEPALSKEELHDKLTTLIRSSKVMVFIKGTPETPRCGFTKQLLNILQEDAVQFGFFDILTDNTVREGLKTFSNWPTYPQVYINGELVGGLDIIKELRSTGEFLKMVSA